MWKTAYAIDGSEVYIDYAKHKTYYSCKECGCKMGARIGGERQHVFYHITKGATPAQLQCAKSSALAHTPHDMSEWHKQWQEKFPEECREYQFSNQRRADIYIHDEIDNIVIEFQHSPISAKIFNGRNEYYRSKEIKVIWLFDFEPYRQEGAVKYIKPELYDDFTKRNKRQGNDVYKISRELYTSTFGDWKPQKDESVTVYFVHNIKDSEIYHSFGMVAGGGNYPLTIFAYKEFNDCISKLARKAWAIHYKKLRQSNE